MEADHPSKPRTPVDADVWPSLRQTLAAMVGASAAILIVGWCIGMMMGAS